MNNRERVYSEDFKLTPLERWAVSQRLSKVIAPLRIMGQHKPTARVLELGCGFSGANLAFIKPQFPQMHFSGMDLRVRSAAHQGIDLFEADLNRWLPPSQWDFVFSLAVVEHLPDPGHHFQLIHDCLGDGGVAVMTTPTPLSFPVLAVLTTLRIFDVRTIRDHKCYLSREGVAFYAQSAGLSIDRHRTFQLGMNQYAVLRRLGG
ncbi:MAG: class I SAM-dependent methyltransferase [Magnetococcales bacterium]|nr:class I SAM-dependent methyltransferase [Magnetococcales bacterium]